jgi:hypothetical protein
MERDVGQERSGVRPIPMTQSEAQAFESRSASMPTLATMKPSRRWGTRFCGERKTLETETPPQGIARAAVLF